MKKNFQFLKDLKKATFKQWLLMTFPYLVVGIPGFLISETLHYYCIRECVEFCDGCNGFDCTWCNVPGILRWIFLAMMLFPMLRNLIGGAIPNLWKDTKEMLKSKKKK